MPAYQKSKFTGKDPSGRKGCEDRPVDLTPAFMVNGVEYLVLWSWAKALFSQADGFVHGRPSPNLCRKSNRIIC